MVDLLSLFGNIKIFMVTGVGLRVSGWNILLVYRDFIVKRKFLKAEAVCFKKL
jgi:hypothetical protein